jgi:hypothetical protein
MKKGKQFGRSLLMLGEHAKLEDLTENQKADPLKLHSKKQFSLPFNLPSWGLNNVTVRAFNFLVYHKNFKKEINNVVLYEPFFYPLDVVLHWNRMLAKGYSYQFFSS